MCAELSELICPRCGASSKKVDFVGTFCVSCKREEISRKITVPKCLRILQCKKCNKIKLKRWVNSLEQLKEQLLSQFKGPFEKSEIISLSDEMCRIDFIFPQLKMRISKSIPIKFSKSICNECAKIARGYYEAVIQIRNGREESFKFAEKIVKELRKETFISAINEFPFGVDIYVGSHAVARTVLSKFGLRTKITRKFYGVKAGKKVFRTTFLIRL